MSQHLAYIDPDEEIISVIGRLRKVAETEVFFAIPKRAVFMQSLVNLRLLEREAKKLGKRLCLVTQDETGRSLAERAGLETRVSLEGVEGAASKSAHPSLPARLSRVDHAASSEGRNPTSPDSVAPLHSESIGSSSFFVEKESAVDFPVGGGGSVVAPSAPALSPTPSNPKSPLQSVPVRDRTPKRLTALNSTRGDMPSPEPRVSPSPSVPKSSPSGVSFTFSPPVKPMSPSQPSQQSPQQRVVPPSLRFQGAPQVSSNSLVAEASPSSRSVSMPSVSEGRGNVPTTSDSSRETLITRFYQNKGPALPPKEPLPPTPVQNPSSDGGVGRGRFRRIVFGCVAVSLLAAIGVSVVIFVPRADVTVSVKELSASEDAEITARTDVANTDIEERRIPLRFIEVEKDIVQSFPGTGQSGVSSKRARGMVTISNAFSTTPQPLVATTRLESPEGKIFRLTKGVTIPGMKEEDGKAVPGTVDAEVSADESGEGYNIAPASFTIPGLKGSPKYDKITALSSSAFVGGGADDLAVASVSVDDVIRAKESSEKNLPEALRAEIEKDLQPGEKLLSDAVLSQTLSEGAFPGTGAVASSFDYRIHVSARALVFSESDVRAIAASILGDGTRPEEVDVEYTVPRPDFNAKSMLVKAKISFSKKQNVDTEAVKKHILGKSVDEVQGVFADYPEIQKIEVVFWPKFMTSRIPSRASQVTMHVEPAVEGE